VLQDLLDHLALRRFGKDIRCPHNLLRTEVQEILRAFQRKDELGSQPGFLEAFRFL